MDFTNLILGACITTFSIGLLALSVVCFRKYRNEKLLFISGVFFIFLIKGIIVTFRYFNILIFSIIEPYFDNGLLDLCVLLLLFLATLKR
ncbi:MAG: hypothetical protein QXL17_04380 [Candidatus Thermoplasmatota archaeon]